MVQGNSDGVVKSVRHLPAPLRKTGNNSCKYLVGSSKNDTFAAAKEIELFIMERLLKDKGQTVTCPHPKKVSKTWEASQRLRGSIVVLDESILD